MTDLPLFPEFKPLALEDREEINRRLWAYQPTTSELTFINLYIWRSYYDFRWALLDDWLLIYAAHPERSYALSPVGPPSRSGATQSLLDWMRDQLGLSEPKIARADRRLMEELSGLPQFSIEPTRDHYDYVYLSEDLGSLAGRKYSKKRNHINQFLRSYEHSYATVTPDLVDACLALAEVWCEQRLCEEDISLTHEFCGIRDALQNFAALHLEGGAIVIDGKVQAFALGELLNTQTAVVHIEKANTEFQGIYPVMTRSFSARWQPDIPYINREQDIGDLGLRQAKESYYPDHLVEKFEVRLA